MDRLLVRGANIALVNVLLQAFVEVAHAYCGVDNGKEDENDRYHRKTGEVLPDGKVVGFVAWLVHPGELEDEIGQTAEVADKCHNHADDALPTGPESG